jgi:hypothetical protein
MKTYRKGIYLAIKYGPGKVTVYVTRTGEMEKVATARTLKAAKAFIKERTA